MTSPGSVTHWVRQIKQGDEEAAQHLWERYFAKLVSFARQQLRHASCREADEEDVALQAFESFHRDVQEGRFPVINDRQDLWRLLIRTTAQKVVDQIRHEQAEKRGGKRRVALSDQEFEQIVGHEPTPAFAVEVAEECQRLLSLLPDEEYRAIALWKMEGYTNEDIAQRINRVPRTVERTLKHIRSLWSRERQP